MLKGSVWTCLGTLSSWGSAQSPHSEHTLHLRAASKGMTKVIGGLSGCCLNQKLDCAMLGMLSQ